jgi:hypothetical protein
VVGTAVVVFSNGAASALDGNLLVLELHILGLQLLLL